MAMKKGTKGINLQGSTTSKGLKSFDEPAGTPSQSLNAGNMDMSPSKESDAVGKGPQGGAVIGGGKEKR